MQQKWKRRQAGSSGLSFRSSILYVPTNRALVCHLNSYEVELSSDGRTRDLNVVVRPCFHVLEFTINASHVKTKTATRVNDDVMTRLVVLLLESCSRQFNQLSELVVDLSGEMSMVCYLIAGLTV